MLRWQCPIYNGTLEKPQRKPKSLNLQKHHSTYLIDKALKGNVVNRTLPSKHLKLRLQSIPLQIFYKQIRRIFFSNIIIQKGLIFSDSSFTN